MQPGCLSTANDLRHAEIALRVEAAIEDLLLAGKRISFYAVAEKGQVARSTLYRSDGLRKLVENARSKAVKSPTAPVADYRSRIAELENELARALAERDELKRAARGAVASRYAVAKLPGAA